MVGFKLYRTGVAITFDTLVQDALVLPPDQRVALAHHLLRSVEPEPDPGAEAAWEQEITRRTERADAGETTPVPASEVFARLRRIAPGRP